MTDEIRHFMLVRIGTMNLTHLAYNNIAQRLLRDTSEAIFQGLAQRALLNYFASEVNLELHTLGFDLEYWWRYRTREDCIFSAY